MLLSGCGGRPAAGKSAADLLFGTPAAGLSPADQQEILEHLGIEVSPEGTLVDPDCGQSVSVQRVEVRDLDGDGVAEVVFLGGNACRSGMAGQSLVIFVRDEAGRYSARLSFPVTSYELVPRPGSLPDARLSGPRPCVAVWRWEAGEYRHLRNEELEPGGCEI
jgi:hypothetical protein